VKTPVCWNSLCFVHVRTDDTTDHYRTEDGVGRLAHQRSTGVWLAELRGAIATAVRVDGEHPALVGDIEVARRALGAALDVLRRRVAADQRWLVMMDEEIGE
jgi:hypothetical protein